MASLQQILNWFKTGLFPSEDQFRQAWLSFWHKQEKIPQSQIFGLQETIESSMFKYPILSADFFDDELSDSNKGTAILTGSTWSNILSPEIQKNINYSVVNNWWNGTAMEDSKVDGVIYRKRGNQYLRLVTEDIVDVRLFGAVGDGVTDDTAAIQRALDTAGMQNLSGVFFFNTGRSYIISEALEIKGNNKKIKGDCTSISTGSVDCPIFNLNSNNQIEISGFITYNNTTTCTFVKATSSHALSIHDIYTDGIKLGYDLYDCYWTKISRCRHHAIYQGFLFREATNAFDVRNVIIQGAGIPSLINNCTCGGDISGCSFEYKSGAISVERAWGLNFTGNYFEGYDEDGVTAYITLGNSVLYSSYGGINISGNLFYSGALSGITMQKGNGVTITGNTFRTVYALRLSGDIGSTQSNINYAGNDYGFLLSANSQTAGRNYENKEILYMWDSTKTANVCSEIKFPFIFQPPVANSRKLNDGEQTLGAINSTVNPSALESKVAYGGIEYKGYVQRTFILASKSFSANEVLEVDFPIKTFASAYAEIIIANSLPVNESGLAVFGIKVNVNNPRQVGYHVVLYNDLGVSVNCNTDGKIIIKNGATAYFYTVMIKI